MQLGLALARNDDEGDHDWEVTKFSAPKGQLLKWIGNKQRFAQGIIAHLPARFGTYFEPFLGSGAVLAALAPRRVELTIHQVLAAAGDPRAATWLQRAHRALLAQADAIADSALRQMFLANIPYHREIVALWAAQGGHR